MRFQFTCVNVFAEWTEFELNEDDGVKALTQKHQKDFKKYIRQISNFQKEYIESTFLNRIDHYKDNKWYRQVCDTGTLPSLFLKSYYEVNVFNV